jgi:hypothetical protein
MLVHFSAQRKHLLCDTLGGCRVTGMQTAQVELRSGGVMPPAQHIHGARRMHKVPLPGPDDWGWGSINETFILILFL